MSSPHILFYFTAVTFTAFTARTVSNVRTFDQAGCPPCDEIQSGGAGGGCGGGPGGPRHTALRRSEGDRRLVNLTRVPAESAGSQSAASCHAPGATPAAASHWATAPGGGGGRSRAARRPGGELYRAGRPADLSGLQHVFMTGLAK